MSPEQKIELAKIVSDPDAWWVNAVAVPGINEEAALAAKLARWEGVYTDTKAERDAADQAAEEAERNKPKTIAQQLAATDAEMSRVEEDLYDMLISIGATTPAQTKAKADNKKALRAQL